MSEGIDRERLTTVGQLIEMLEEHDPDQIIGFAYPANDYARQTIVVSPLKAEEETVHYTSYHRSMVLDDGDNRDGSEAWVILSE